MLLEKNFREILRKICSVHKVSHINEIFMTKNLKWFVSVSENEYYGEEKLETRTVSMYTRDIVPLLPQQFLDSFSIILVKHEIFNNFFKKIVASTANFIKFCLKSSCRKDYKVRKTVSLESEVIDLTFELLQKSKSLQKSNKKIWSR